MIFFINIQLILEETVALNLSKKCINHQFVLEETVDPGKPLLAVQDVFGLQGGNK